MYQCVVEPALVVDMQPYVLIAPTRTNILIFKIYIIQINVTKQYLLNHLSVLFLITKIAYTRTVCSQKRYHKNQQLLQKQTI
jgi:hypothetical protein